MMDRRNFLKAIGAVGIGAVGYTVLSLLRPASTSAQVLLDNPEYSPVREFLDPKTLGPKSFFDQYDPQGSGRVTLDQYLKIEMGELEKSLEDIPPEVTGLYKGAYENQARKAFEKYSKGRGYITQEDLK